MALDGPALSCSRLEDRQSWTGGTPSLCSGLEHPTAGSREKGALKLRLGRAQGAEEPSTHRPPWCPHLLNPLARQHPGATARSQGRGRAEGACCVPAWAGDEGWAGGRADAKPGKGLVVGSPGVTLSLPVRAKS